ncbi:MAG: carbon monoxide dehydrogenase [Rhodospirillaceae bacterium]|nr:carbon monoxide dehydrogenase [Rhodospirillaceae bacterium]|tara:strand:+ start:2013 stop:4337 length:2325 start_codon:yes stop_codon:yes gene_type:complete
MGEYALGQAIPRSEDPRLLRGGGRYVDDVQLPHMARAWILRSPFAHANIKSIDTSDAEAAPGVLLVITGKDWEESGWGDLPVASGQKRPDGSPMFVPPMPPIVTDGRVRRVGDYVAMVVAETENQAKDACEMIDVDYEILPSVTSGPLALQDGAPAVYDDCPDNICFLRELGDKDAVDAAFEKAHHITRHELHITRVMAATMEPRGCTAHYSSFDDTFTLYTTLQGVHPYRATLAQRILKVSESKVRVIAQDVGGSFGMKSPIYAENPLCLLASRKLDRPVKWLGDRSEAFLSDYGGRDNLWTGELALDKDNKFIAMRGFNIANLGAYIGNATPGPAINNLGTIAGVYTTPYIYINVTGVITNSNTMTPYRGAGRPEAAYVIERLIDLAAEELEIDPTELRRINTIPPDAMPFKTGLTFTYDSGEFEKNMDLALDMSDYTDFESRREEAKAKGKLRGIGVSNTIERAAAPGIEAAEIRVDRSGTVTILSGSCTQGQGHETVYKQIVCDKLGLKPEDVTYVWGDTEKVAFGHGAGGSRSATLGGSAVLMATDKIIEKATKVAAHQLEAAVEDIEFHEGTFAVAGTDKTIEFSAVAKAAIVPASVPDGLEPGLNEQATYTAEVMNYPNGCHVCEIEIDPDTGIVEILKYSVIDDVGTVMNPLLLKGQIQGGIAQGVGQALLEEIVYDDDGQLITGSFMDYAMPRAEHMSYMEVIPNAVPTKTNPLGVKGAGEAGNVGGLAAVMNAVINALQPLGVSHVDMPLSPERLWRTIQEATG